MRNTTLIVNADPRIRSTLRGILEGAKDVVMEASDAEAALAMLSESECGVVVLFDIALPNNTLTGLDSVAILGVAAHDTHLTDRHAFVVITPTPENVELVFGRTLAQINAPIVGEPIDPDALHLAVARASQHLLVTA
jgi:DNA-binding NtrC family response regulator